MMPRLIAARAMKIRTAFENGFWRAESGMTAAVLFHGSAFAYCSQSQSE